MTALPSLTRPLTAAEYAALPEDTEHRNELEEGMLVMSPSPLTRHQRRLLRLAIQVERQLPGELDVVMDNDVDLELVEPGRPGFVRRPDLTVVPRTVADRVERDGGLLRARDVLLVVEMISPGSYRRDTVVKRAEYADAGIPHYWIVDLDAGPGLTACHLAGEFGYSDAGSVTSTFTTASPCPITLDLDALG